MRVPWVTRSLLIRDANGGNQAACFADASHRPRIARNEAGTPYSNRPPSGETSTMQFEIQMPLLPDMVRLNARWYPSKAAVIDEQRSLSWRELDRASNQIANGLRALGVGRGESVAILMENSVEYLEVLYGIFKSGATAVPLNLAVTESGLTMMLRDAAARVLFCTATQFRRLAEHLADVGSLVPDGVIVHEAEGLNYASWRDAQSDAAPEVRIADDDPCNIIYSSGTTSTPKGIKHIHRRRIQSIYELALGHRYHYGAISICPIGLYSNIAWASILCSLLVGGTCVIRRSFEPEAWIEDVKRYGVTHTMMVPIMFQRVLEAPNFTAEAVSSLQAIISGGSPLYESLKQRLGENFRGCAVIELYGLTEGFMTMLQPEEAEGKLRSVGKPVRGNDYILLDDQDREVPWGGTGEICVRSVHWMIEYHNRPEATREAMFIDAKGLTWLRTGDIGRTDEEGYLYITDRKKDMILSGGQNIYPADIELVMAEHPLVAEVGVIGVPDQKWGETPIAVVVLRENAPPDAAQQLLRWTNERVGKRQRIRSVVIRENLPRNPNGKILKRELRKEFMEQT